MTKRSPVAMGQARLARERRFARAIPRAVGAERNIIEALPFKPTRAQMDAYSDIAIDMGRPVPHAPHDPGRRRLRQNPRRSSRRRASRSRSRHHRADVPYRSPRPQQAEAIGRFLAPLGIRVAALTGRDKGYRA